MRGKDMLRGRRFGGPGEGRGHAPRWAGDRRGGHGDGPERPDPRGRGPEGHGDSGGHPRGGPRGFGGPGERPQGGPRGFGGPGGRPRGRGDGSRAGRGDVRAAILTLLGEQALHGYEIIQQITARSGGAWQPSPGSVYPALQLLEDQALVQSEQVVGKRVYHLTDAGRTYVEQHQDAINATWNGITDPVDSALVALRDLHEQVGSAVRQVVQAGTDAQIAAARELLTTTRRQLYRILADDQVGGVP